MNYNKASGDTRGFIYFEIGRMIRPIPLSHDLWTNLVSFGNDLMDAKTRAADQQILCSEKKLTDRQFLESMSRIDLMIDHEPDTTCGMCHHQFLMAQVARDLIASGETENVIVKWSEESERLWRESKFVKLWEEAEANNKDPNQVFEELGWEP